MVSPRPCNCQISASAGAEDVALKVATGGVGTPDEAGAAVIIHPPKALRRKKRCAGPARSAAGPSPEVLQAVADCVDELYCALIVAQTEPGAAPAALAQVHCCADRLAAIGAAHRHRLIERIAALLTRTGGRLQTIDAAAVPLLKAHADALRAVVHDRPDGNAGTVGEDLIACLTALNEKAECERP